MVYLNDEGPGVEPEVDPLGVLPLLGVPHHPNLEGFDVFNSSLCLGYSLSLKHTQNIIFLHLFIPSFVCLSLSQTPPYTHTKCAFSLSVSYSLSLSVFCFLLHLLDTAFVSF